MQVLVRWQQVTLPSVKSFLNVALICILQIKFYFEKNKIFEVDAKKLF